ncbi:MAG: HAD hydrolase family protein [Desulfobacteraceae bacterium]|nr:HAD hydrolase family protein [Desulfobacteraceae bacterium]
MIQVLVLDIDGVLTDGKVTLDDSGRERKTLSYRDIDAVFLAQRRGLQVVLVTGEAVPLVDTIARRLEISHVYRGAKDKCQALRSVCTELGVSLQQVCYVGDSQRDADALAMVGLGLAPSDAIRAAQVAAHRVLQHQGGDGAVAEAVEIILQALEATGDTDPAE